MRLCIVLRLSVYVCTCVAVCAPRCVYVRARSRKAPTVGLEPTTTRLRAVRSAGWAKRAATSAAAQSANCKCATQLPPQFGPANAAELQRAIWRAEMDTLGIEPRAFRMRSGCDTTTPCARDCCAPAMSIPAIAQLVEHLTVEPCSNQMVPGSIPGGRNSCANAHPMAASNLRRICETSRHRGSNPGRSGGGRVSPPTRLERNFWMSSVRVGGVRGMMVVFIACVVEWLRRSQLTL